MSSFTHTYVVHHADLKVVLSLSLSIYPSISLSVCVRGGWGGQLDAELNTKEEQLEQARMAVATHLCEADVKFRVDSFCFFFFKKKILVVAQTSVLIPKRTTFESEDLFLGRCVSVCVRARVRAWFAG